MASLFFFCVAELFDDICVRLCPASDFCEPVSSGQTLPGLGDLASLARTCKSCNAVASSRMWHTQTQGMMPFMGLLTGGVHSLLMEQSGEYRVRTSRKFSFKMSALPFEFFNI